MQFDSIFLCFSGVSKRSTSNFIGNNAPGTVCDVNFKKFVRLEPHERSEGVSLFIDEATKHEQTQRNYLLSALLLISTDEVCSKLLLLPHSQSQKHASLSVPR